MTEFADYLDRCTFPSRGSVTCAVSGGADSLALLVLATASGLDVTAVHVDHGLRPTSSADADVVAKAADQLGAKFRSERVELVVGPNLEARARAARYAVLPPDVMTGHTADDQAETILLAMMRGAGLRGLAGMSADPRHPILGLRRFETEAICATAGLAPVFDESNTDPTLRRNRVRHELLPLLDDIAKRDVAAIIARQATNLSEEDAFLDDLADAIDPTQAKDLAGAPPVLARRAVRRWLNGWITDHLGQDHPPDAAAVERVLAVARNEVLSCELSGGIRVQRSHGVLSLVAPVSQHDVTA